MHAKRILMLTAGALLALAGAVEAQQTTATTGLKELEDDAMMVQPYNRMVSDLEDMDIYGPGGEEIGEVEEILGDATGNPAALTAEVGGFLGIGEKEVVLDLSMVRMEGDRLVTALTKEQLEALPEWDD